MYKTLYVNGCSWTNGHELETDPAFVNHLNQMNLKLVKNSLGDFFDVYNLQNEKIGSDFQYWNEMNWAGVIAKKLNLNIVNQSTGGGSNDRILRTTVDYVRNLSEEKRKETIVIIGWTESSRSELYLDDGNGHRNWYRFNYLQKFSKSLTLNERPTDDFIRRMDSIQKDWLVTIYNDYERMHRYFHSAYMLSNLLENLKIKYYFFNALQCWFYRHESSSNSNIYNEFHDWIHWNDHHPCIRPLRDTMQHFINVNRYPVGVNNHPLTAGHSGWANTILQDIIDRKII